MMRKLLLGAAALAIGLGGFWWTQRGQSAVQAAPLTSAAAPVPVVAGTAVARDVPVYADGLGTVQAYNAVTVRSRVDGQIMKVFFAEGQEVKEGDPLFQIDPRPYQAAVDQAVATQQKDEAQLVSAKADLQRFSKLLTGGYQTQQAYDTQKALVGQIEASIKADAAAIDTARLNLGYADIRAPLSGRTGARLVDPGNLIHASDGTALVSITQLKPIFVDFTIPQSHLIEIRHNQETAPLAVEALDANATEVLDTGKLTLIDNQVDTTTGTIHLKATFDNARAQLWPGQFVNARLILSTRKGAVTVPATTVQQGPDGYYAYVIKPDQTVERRTLQLDGFQQGQAIVTTGLVAGEKIVVDGQFRLSPGARVQATQSLAQGGAAPAAPASGS
jgi:membrane fusion protein, multidrug efflux system